MKVVHRKRIGEGTGIGMDLGTGLDTTGRHGKGWGHRYGYGYGWHPSFCSVPRQSHTPVTDVLADATDACEEEVGAAHVVAECLVCDHARLNGLTKGAHCGRLCSKLLLIR